MRQDRQGVRTPADLERKYNLGEMAQLKGSSTEQADQIKQLTQTLAQYMATTNATFVKLEEHDLELDNAIVELDETNEHQSIVLEVYGDPIILTDSSNFPLKNLRLYGKTVQYSTPLPSVPADLVSLCRYGNITVTVGASMTDELPQALTIPVRNGFPGVPVSSGGDYTDENGQEWVSDYIDLERGVYVQKIGVIDSYAGEEITSPYLSTTGELTDGATVQYILPEPIETNLPDSTMPNGYNPTTVISNDAGAWQFVEYVADTKTYIDNKGGGADLTGCVLYNVVQELDASHKEIARENIGAASQDDVNTLSKKLDDVGTVPSITLLWTNNEPNVEFASQTVEVDLSGYDMYEVIYAPSTAYYTREMSMRARVGKGCILIGLWADTDRIFHRGITAASAGLTFGNAWDNKATNNAYCIPIAIYGIRGVT